MNIRDSMEIVQNDKTKDVLRVVKSLVIDVLHQTLKYVRDISSAPLLKFELDELREEAEHRIKNILSEDQANKYNLKTKMKGDVKMNNTDRWQPEAGERYYYVSSLGNVEWHLWEEAVDTLYYKVGNCFKTKEEAQEVANTWKRLLNEYYANKNLNQNSLYISETARLPDWCKQNEWIFDYNEREYAQVKDIFGDIAAVALTYAGTKEQVTKSWKYIADCCCQAKVHPYYDHEMQQLVGKILDNGIRRVMVTACAPICWPERPQKKIFMADNWYTAENLITHGYNLDNRPCGVLEHLEAGVWVYD